jgi:hypothetical protein
MKVVDKYETRISSTLFCMFCEFRDNKSTPYRRVLLEKLTVAQLVKIILALYGK